jgi:hypothetical protein
MQPERPYGHDEEPEEDDLQPGDPDYDLSEAHGYLWHPPQRSWPPRWLIVAVTVAVIAALVIPSIIIALNR